MYEDYLKRLTKELCDKYQVPLKGGIYPEITDKQFLELITISSQLFPVKYAFERGVEELKWVTLEALINYNDITGQAKTDIQEILGEVVKPTYVFRKF